jgi:hypothetical protein
LIAVQLGKAFSVDDLSLSNKRGACSFKILEILDRKSIHDVLGATLGPALRKAIMHHDLKFMSRTLLTLIPSFIPSC